MRGSNLAALILAVLALAGCEGDLPDATEIARMRVLGVRFEVEDGEGRATPAPGDSVRASLPVVFPSTSDDASQVRVLLIGCTAPDRFTGGLPICQEFIDAASAGEDPIAALPDLDGNISCEQIEDFGGRFQRGALSVQCVHAPSPAAGGTDPAATFMVPDDFEAEKLLFLGVVCERSAPFIDPEDPLLFGCEDAGAEAIRVHGTIPVQYRAADVNRNPALDALELEREGVPWPAYDPAELPPEDDCDQVVPHDDPVVHSIVTGEHLITIRYDAAAREDFEGEPEDLEITIYATLGDMERRFTLFEGSDPGVGGVLESDLFWDPPKVDELLAAGETDPTDEMNKVQSKLVRFFVTLRDQRGGFAMTERAVCLR